ncbi:GntR family transcriptional regulator [Brucella intermedia 229E]|uniref:GntR family transcriptional regulator n=1 Tax=Brucella intermedia 229E TaxID=1337887 RepID=U4V168_9HYPH|nr:GntR family transcriptional regulator [Brucella intermedia 229E]
MNRTTLITAIEERGLHDPQLTGGPLYRNLARILGELIEEGGELAPAVGLPPERDLAEQLGVGRITVRNAYKELLTQGVVEARRGSGTFVAERPARISQHLWRLTSFSEDMLSRGKEPGARVVTNKVDRPSPDEAFRLGGVGVDTTVVRLDRLRLADGVPMAFERAVVPRHFLDQDRVDETSLYGALARRGHKPVRALQRLTAVTLDPGIARLLGVHRGAPALLIERVSHLEDDRIVEYTRSHYRADAYDFVALRLAR